MKRLTLSFLTLCFALVTMAEPISKQAALYSAQAYMLAKGKNVNATQVPFKSSRKGASQQTTEENPYYYVFNAGNNDGYVIVSGDDRTEPILGYVDHGTFDPENIPENMRSWLQLYADEIKFIIDNNIQPNDPIIKKRNKVAGTKHSVGEMLTTRWNQGRPYNLTCPDYYREDDVEEADTLPLRVGPATGCTATAMAQVMYFYKYPAKVKKEIPAYSITYTSKKDNSVKKTINIPRIPRNTVIDWENMRDTYSWQGEAYANVNDTAVANLMRYCGQAVTMHYGPSSGANFSAEAYIDYFGFANGAHVGERRDYTIDDWFDAIYNEIDLGYPVLISGFSSGGGHAFVIDGFDGDNLFHLNWGWGGGSNGWFLVGILNPGDTSGIGASSSSDGYSMSQRALFNLRVPNTPKTDSYLTITDVSISGTNIEVKFTNKTGATGTFHTGIVMMEEDGSLTLVGNRLSSSLSSGASATKKFPIANKLPEGTYRLSPASKPSRSEEWNPEYDFLTQYIEAVVDSTGAVVYLQFHKPVYTGESISIDTIVFPGTRIAGKEQEVKVTFRNNGAEYFKTIYMHASKTANSPTSSTYVKSKSQVAVRTGETVDVSYFFTPAETGTYKLWFCTSDNGSGIIGQGTIEAITEAQSNKGSLTVNSYTITNAVNGVIYGKQLVGQAKIKNNKNAPFHGKIKLQIWNQPNSSGSAWGGSTKTYEVDILSRKIATIDFSFDGLSENNKYYISVSCNNADVSSGGVWDLGGWEMKCGIAAWKSDGVPTGKAHNKQMAALSSWCGVYADCSKEITLMTPNSNPNTIYAFGESMDLPTGLDSCNLVHGKHANHINLVSDSPYYLPATFRADTASFTYTFPETEDGTAWHAITIPFRVDSILIDSIPVTLDDTLNHFWIYEYATENINAQAIFKPAKSLRGGTPYIIAADSTMAGQSIVFRSHNVPFYKSGTDQMVVTSLNYKFHGNTYSPKVKGCYVLNAEGTAFEYTTTTKTLPAMESYFTTTLPDSLAPASIVLPDIPLPVKNLTLDEMAVNTINAGTYGQLTLKRTFDSGYNTICLPFQIDNVGEIFGQEAQAYKFFSFTNNELNFVKVDTLAAGMPYIIILPEAISEDIILTDITIDEESTQAGAINKYGTNFCGTYAPIFAGSLETAIYGLDVEGSIIMLEGESLTDTAPILVKGFRAFFELPTEEAVTICLYDDPTGIKTIFSSTLKDENIYNLAGQRINKMQKGIYIVNGKKILK